MRGKEKKSGFYNNSVLLTNIGLVSSVFGITQVFENHMSIAFLCLLLSGICDLFDGKIARSMKNRTEHEKVFGIQNDSLCDLVCYGVFVAVGSVPDTKPLANLVKTDKDGYIIADESGKTSADGIFAGGDIRTKALRQVVTAVSDGANCVISAEKYLDEKQ